MLVLYAFNKLSLKGKLRCFNTVVLIERVPDLPGLVIKVELRCYGILCACNLTRRVGISHLSSNKRNFKIIDNL